MQSALPPKQAAGSEKAPASSKGNVAMPIVAPIFVSQSRKQTAGRSSFTPPTHQKRPSQSKLQKMCLLNGQQSVFNVAEAFPLLKTVELHDESLPAAFGVGGAEWRARKSSGRQRSVVYERMAEEPKV